MCVAGVVTFGVCLAAAMMIDNYVVMSKTLFELTKITSIAIICAVVYTGLNLLLKMDYARELWERVLNKLKF